MPPSPRPTKEGIGEGTLCTTPFALGIWGKSVLLRRAGPSGHYEWGARGPAGVLPGPLAENPPLFYMGMKPSFKALESEYSLPCSQKHSKLLRQLSDFLGCTLPFSETV